MRWRGKPPGIEECAGALGHAAVLKLKADVGEQRLLGEATPPLVEDVVDPAHRPADRCCGGVRAAAEHLRRRVDAGSAARSQSVS